MSKTTTTTAVPAPAGPDPALQARIDAALAATVVAVNEAPRDCQALCLVESAALLLCLALSRVRETPIEQQIIAALAACSTVRVTIEREANP